MDQMQSNQTLMLQNLLRFQEEMKALSAKVDTLNTDVQEIKNMKKDEAKSTADTEI